tara:strand:+ start:3249 stop:4043 length:795 start_codon:yes stop_codon:yes gene_type:complete
MLDIAFKALKLGAETINQDPIKYNKSRISGSDKTTYILHIKGACMPGREDIFTTTSCTKPNFNSNLLVNPNMSYFRRKKIDSYKYKILNENINSNNYSGSFFQVNEFVPNDDDSLIMAITALYKNIFGNLSLMESERPIDIERKLRNGDITIREFTRKICQSNIYRKFYFENISQYKSIYLRYKHILGRPVLNQNEIHQSSNILNEFGFDAHIDWLIDSEEYIKNFGEDIVPYMRSWNSSIGLKTITFLETSSITKSFSSSDIC